jgi:spore coat polysaccharide biosynthesis predicted glycosyltransferase SpsG
MIIFRADVSSRTGQRHLRRCAYLAALLKKNNDVLICSLEDKKTAKFLAEKKIPFSLVKDPAVIDISGAKAVVFDIDSFSSQDIALLEKAKKAGVNTIQVVPANGESRPADITIFPFAAAEDALLHHKLRHFNRARRKYHKNIKNIFINLGDLLPYRDMRQTVDTLHRLHLRMKIAPGLNLKKADKRNLMRIYPGIHFCGKSESPARAYFEADLALIPAGEEALEAAAVGTPALYMPPDKGQDTLVEICADLGTGVKIPHLADFSVQTVRDILAPLTLERREQIGAIGRKLVDGLGVQRFLKLLKENGIINSEHRK